MRSGVSHAAASEGEASVAAKGSDRRPGFRRGDQVGGRCRPPGAAKMPGPPAAGHHLIDNQEHACRRRTRQAHELLGRVFRIPPAPWTSGSTIAAATWPARRVKTR